MSFFLNRAETVPYLTCGVSAPYLTGRDILRQHRTGRNDGSASDMDSGKNDGTGPDPDIIADNRYATLLPLSIPHRLPGSAE